MDHPLVIVRLLRGSRFNDYEGVFLTMRSQQGNQRRSIYRMAACCSEAYGDPEPRQYCRMTIVAVTTSTCIKAQKPASGILA